jgi:hypothetical protein
MKTFWRYYTVPADENEFIVVVYRDGDAVVTCWADEEAEERLGDIVRWLPIRETTKIDTQRNVCTGRLNADGIVEFVE